MMMDTKSQIGCGEMSNAIVGLCTTDSNPDAWFPDVPVGRQAPSKLTEVGNEAARAIALCNICPKQEGCLDEGMKPENLAFGIWGGMLAGERVVVSGKRFAKLSDEGRALISYRALRPWIKETV
jgi:hypothetical protein